MKRNLWSSRKTGQVLYPGIILFFIIIIAIGNSMAFEEEDEQGVVRSINFWELLKWELQE